MGNNIIPLYLKGAYFMGRIKINADEKINTILDILSGKETRKEAANRLSVDKRTVGDWIIIYQSIGIDAFTRTDKTAYSQELKEQAVLAYLNGEGSQRNICKRFCIKDKHTLQAWIMKYNSHEELKASGTGGTDSMTKGRSTTFEERVEIASYCIANQYKYSEAANKYNVSYQQARNFTIKYEKHGLQGLHDNRGKHKSKEELTELDKLKAELKLEKSMRIKAEMEASLLKKLDEIERRRG